MSNWYGTARSNTFTVVDMDGLKQALSPFADIEIRERAGKVCLLVTDGDYGGWPSCVFTENEEEHEFDPAVCVMPYVKEGEVVVFMEAGAEKLRYITGNAQAFIRKDSTVTSVSISLDDIYHMAAEKFGLDVGQINVAEY